MNFSKNVFNKSWRPQMIFFNEKKKFRKMRTIFVIKKWLWKSEFCNLSTLSTLSKRVQKILQINFRDSASVSFIVTSFHQYLLTWWNAYTCRNKQQALKKTPLYFAIRTLVSSIEMPLMIHYRLFTLSLFYVDKATY